MLANNKLLLRKKAFDGLLRLRLEKKKEYIDRLEYELEVVISLGFETYFLIVADLVNEMRKQMLVGPARGSAAGSLLAYCLGITKIDPIKFGLLFSRFMATERKDPPDIDIDLEDRDIAIEYLKERYGKENVARVGSYNLLRTKSAIWDIGRNLGWDFQKTKNLADLVPPPRAGLWDSFEDEVEVEPKLLDPKYAEVIGPAGKLWGTLRSYGTHAGGIVISPKPIIQMIPLYVDKEKNLVAQYDKEDIEKAGLIKFDILGLSTLKVISLCLKYIKRAGKTVNLETLEDEDKKAYQLICSGDLDGVFQIGGGGSDSIRSLVVDLRPTNITDLCLIISAFRPGPLSSGLVGTMVDIRNGKKQANYIHPALIPILSHTYGIAIYQEDCMKISTEIAGYTLEESNNFRKILAKKKKDLMELEREKFVQKAFKNGFPLDKAEELFRMLEGYASYLFNLSHGISYAHLSYYTAYLKAHFPLEFYAALLSCEKNPDRIIQYSSSARMRGITILPPCIQKSGVYHQPEGKAIRFGLSHIKGVSEEAMKKVVAFRDA